MSVFLTAEWRQLLIFNFDVDPDLLLPLVPRGTELDLWRGRAYVSLVGFRFLRARLLGVPVPFHAAFEEVNLRIYVKREADEGLRRGVVFVKEIVPKPAVAFVARWVYDEPYVTLPTAYRVEPSNDDGPDCTTVEYRWRLSGTWNVMRAAIIGPPQVLVPGSEEEFVTEHYWGYTALATGGSREYRVEHEPWTTLRAASPELRCDALALYGRSFADAMGGEPASAFFAQGSPVKVYRGRVLPTRA